MWRITYHRFDMSFRAVEELLFERGIELSYETVRRWCSKFGSEYARWLKRCRVQPGDKWVAYILWQAMPFIPFATDTFVIRDGKIVTHSFAMPAPTSAGG